MPASLASSAALPIDTTAVRILVVDDDATNRGVLTGLLEPLGYETTEADSGVAALRAAAEAVPDLILLDVMMPGMDGFEVCRHLRATPATALVPIVMITALDADKHKVRGLEAEADDFLTKPVDEVELEVRVRALARRSRLQARLHTTESVLLALANAIEVRDDVTGQHVRRLANNVDLLATALDLDAAGRSALQWAAVLHDVGKIGVPDEILGKPGPLSDDEWVVMRRHPELGEKIVLPLDGLGDVRAIIRHHHERWDGAGYPDGLSGDGIPYLARAFQLIDVFDALTATRPYKRALDRQEAIEVMSGEAGAVLDPHLAAVFLEQVALQCAVEVRDEVVEVSS